MHRTLLGSATGTVYSAPQSAPFNMTWNKLVFLPILLSNIRKRSSMERRSNVGRNNCRETITTFAVVFCAVIWSGHKAKATANAARAEVLHQGCQDCCSIEKSDAGLMLRSTVGRTSGAGSGYNDAPASSLFPVSSVPWKAGHETASMPWSAPVGHHQPRAVDIPTSISASRQIPDEEDAKIDRKIRGICQGC
jgi:hypothetical protein